MAIINKNGQNISFECSELILELRRDIEEFGKDFIFAVWIRKSNGIEIIVNYDFIESESPIKTNEIKQNERIAYMQADLLLETLEKQNSIF